jgi:deoxyadenosine/deoxycytidine kinase
MNRIKKRNRAGEQDMQYDYLDKCNRYHDDWLITDPTTQIPVLILNANQENSDYSADIYKYIYNVRTSKIIGVLHQLKMHVNCDDNNNGTASSCVNV